MRILQVHPLLRGDGISPLAGGKSRVSRELSRYLSEQGHEVAVFPYPERLYDVSRSIMISPQAKLRLLPTSLLPARSQLRLVAAWLRRTMRGPRGESGERWSEIQALVALDVACREYRPDIVHCHHTFSGFPYLYRATGGVAPLVLTHHAYRPSQDLTVYDWVILVSRSQVERLRNVPGFRPERSPVIRNPVSAIFSEGEVIPAERRSGLVFSGAPNSYKGMNLLLEAYALEKRLWDHPLVVTGTSEETSRYRAEAEARKLPIQFRGRLSLGDLKAVLSSARLMVIPSLGEGLSTALLEAVCEGTPVVGWISQVEEMTETLGIRAGYPFNAQCQSAQELAQTILEALADEGQLAPRREALAQKARQAYSQAHSGEAILALYRQALGGGPG